MSMDREIDTRTEMERGDSRSGLGGERQGTAERARDRAGELVSDARDTATEQIESRKSRAADTLSGVARSLRSSGQQLQGEEESAAHYMRQAADQVERMAGYLQHKDIGEMIDQAEDLARRQPALFVGGAFVLGLLGARFLKSSRERLEREEFREGRHLPEPMSDFQRGRFDRPQTGYAPPTGVPDRQEPTPTTRPNIPDYGPPSPEIGVGYAASPPDEPRGERAEETESPDRRPR